MSGEPEVTINYDFMDETPAPEPAQEPSSEPVAAEPAPASPDPAPAPVAASEPSPEPVKPPPGFVPHGAMAEERARRQELERKLAEIEARQAQKPAEPAEKPWPDPITDPEAYNARVREELRIRDERLSRFETEQRQAQERQFVLSSLSQAAAAQRQATPDFDAAVQHAVAAYKQELAIFNPEADEAAIMGKISADIEMVAARAIQARMNPAEVIYNLAKARGYRPPEPTPAPTLEAPAPAPGLTAPAAPQGGMTALQKIAEAAKASSLATASGAPAPTQLSVTDLAALSAEEIASMDESELRKVLSAA